VLTGRNIAYKRVVHSFIESVGLSHVSSKRGESYMGAKLGVRALRLCLKSEKRRLHTPAINRPKAKPSSFKLQKLNEVFAGLHRLPGASNFEKPSTKTTLIKETVDTMPRSDAYERRGNGRKTVGIRLNWSRRITK
jgi:hypothetical protein